MTEFEPGNIVMVDGEEVEILTTGKTEDCPICILQNGMAIWVDKEKINKENNYEEENREN